MKKSILFVLMIIFSCSKYRKGGIEKDKKTIDSLFTELGKSKIHLEELKKEVENDKKEKFGNEDFNRFFYTFMTDSNFQKNRIKFPLKYNTYDIDSMKDIKLEIQKSEWEFNSFYFNSSSERTQIYDNFELNFQPTNQRLLHWYGIETGGDSRYYFEGFEGKWFLIKKEDSGI